jgi:hypothetical protein
LKTNHYSNKGVFDMKWKISLWIFAAAALTIINTVSVFAAQTTQHRATSQQLPSGSTSSVPTVASGGCNIPYNAPGAIIVNNPTLISALEIKFYDAAAGERRLPWNPPGVAPRFAPSLACFNGAAIDIGRMPTGVTCWMLPNNLSPSGSWAVNVISCFTAGADSGRPPTQSTPATDPGQPAAIIDPLFKSGGGK